MNIKEVDILRNGDMDDLLSDEVWCKVLADIQAGNFDYVICSPPCHTHSRAVWQEGPVLNPCVLENILLVFLGCPGLGLLRPAPQTSWWTERSLLFELHMIRRPALDSCWSTQRTWDVYAAEGSQPASGSCRASLIWRPTLTQSPGHFISARLAELPASRPG